MSNKKELNKKFKPYTVDYVSDLLQIVKSDVQDNTRIGEEDYLDVALKACQEFNGAFGNKSFDKGE